MIRRGRALVAATALLAAGCTGGGQDAAPEAGPATTAPGPATAPVTGPGPSGAPADSACAGLGPAPADGVVTWVAGGRLRADGACLVSVPEAGIATAVWGGAGDRVLVGDTVYREGGPPVRPLPGNGVVLSRPTGTAVLQVTDDGRLLKRALDGGEPRDISFLPRHENVLYHPAGRHIVSAGLQPDGTAELAIADNEGRGAAPLVSPEGVKRIADLAFTASGALLFTADHGDRVVLHRLVLESGAAPTTVDSVAAPGTIAFVTASPFPGGGVAWTRGRCGAGAVPVTRATRGGEFLELAGTDVVTARPVGWLPDGSLVAATGGRCEDGTAGDLVAFKDGKVTVRASAAAAPAVRAVLPPPPEPPTWVAEAEA